MCCMGCYRGKRVLFVQQVADRYVSRISWIGWIARVIRYGWTRHGRLLKNGWQEIQRGRWSHSTPQRSYTLCIWSVVLFTKKQRWWRDEEMKGCGDEEMSLNFIFSQENGPAQWDGILPRIYLVRKGVVSFRIQLKIYFARRGVLQYAPAFELPWTLRKAVWILFVGTIFILKLLSNATFCLIKK